MSSVLFLCTGNYYRSRFAEEYFNHEAQRRPLIWRAVSRGLARDMSTTGNVGTMASDARDALRALGIEAADGNRYPITVTAADFESHTRIVALSRSEHLPMIQSLFPEFADRVQYLDIEDGHLESVDSALSRLARCIDAMLNELC